MGSFISHSEPEKQKYNKQTKTCGLSTCSSPHNTASELSILYHCNSDTLFLKVLFSLIYMGVCLPACLYMYSARKEHKRELYPLELES